MANKRLPEEVEETIAAKYIDTLIYVINNGGLDDMSYDHRRRSLIELLMAFLHDLHAEEDNLN